jgi:hypothetical protein
VRLVGAAPHTLDIAFMARELGTGILKMGDQSAGKAYVAKN